MGTFFSKLCNGGHQSDGDSAAESAALLQSSPDTTEPGATVEEREDLHALISVMKRKYSTCSNKGKLQLLTLLPPDWDVFKVRTYFPDVTNRVWRRVMSLRSQEGVLSVLVTKGTNGSSSSLSSSSGESGAAAQGGSCEIQHDNGTTTDKEQQSDTTWRCECGTTNPEVMVACKTSDCPGWRCECTAPPTVNTSVHCSQCSQWMCRACNTSAIMEVGDTSCWACGSHIGEKDLGDAGKVEVVISDSCFMMTRTEINGVHWHEKVKKELPILCPHGDERVLVLTGIEGRKKRVSGFTEKDFLDNLGVKKSLHDRGLYVQDCALVGIQPDAPGERPRPGHKQKLDQPESYALLNDPACENLKFDVLDVAVYYRDPAALLKYIRDFQPEVIILAWCWSQFSDVAQLLRREGIVAELCILSDMGRVTGVKLGKLDPYQQGLVNKVASGVIKDALLYGPHGSGKTLVGSQIAQSLLAMCDSPDTATLYVCVVSSNIGNRGLLASLRSVHFRGVEENDCVYDDRRKILSDYNEGNVGTADLKNGVFLKKLDNTLCVLNEKDEESVVYLDEVMPEWFYEQVVGGDGVKGFGLGGFNPGKYEKVRLVMCVSSVRGGGAGDRDYSRYRMCVDEGEMDRTLLVANMKLSYRCTVQIQQLLRFCEAHNKLEHTIYDPDYETAGREGEVPVWVICRTVTEADAAAEQIRQSAVTVCREENCSQEEVTCHVCSQQHSCRHVEHLHSKTLCYRDWNNVSHACGHNYTCRLCGDSEQCYYVQDIVGAEDDCVIILVNFSARFYKEPARVFSRARRQLYVVSYGERASNPLFRMLTSAAQPHTHISGRVVSCLSKPCPHLGNTYIKKLTYQEFINQV